MCLGVTDDGGRYTFIKQPGICLWNLQKLAEAIHQALPLNVSTPLLELYEEEFQATYLRIMRSKVLSRFTSIFGTMYKIHILHDHSLRLLLEGSSTCGFVVNFKELQYFILYIFIYSIVYFVIFFLNRV